MTAQQRYISSVLTAFSTFLENLDPKKLTNDSDRSKKDLKIESQKLLIKFLNWKKQFTSWSPEEIEQFVADNKLETKNEPAAVTILTQFVNDYPPLQTNMFLQEFLLALQKENCSQSTIKNYRSDISQFIQSSAAKTIDSLLTKTKLDAFSLEQKQKGLKSSTIKRKFSSVIQFGLWLKNEGLLSDPPQWLEVGYVYELEEKKGEKNQKEEQEKIVAVARVKKKIQPEEATQLAKKAPSKQKAIPAKAITVQPGKRNLLNLKDKKTKSGQEVISTTNTNSTKPSALRNQEKRAQVKSGLSQLSTKISDDIKEKFNQTFNQAKQTASQAKQATALNILPYINLAIIILFFLGLGSLGYKQLITNAPFQYAFPSTPTPPGRTLSFQGRLTDPGQNPITQDSDMVFILYDALTAGTTLWTSNTCTIEPDQDGIFTVGLGDTTECGPAIPDGVFTENPNVWLEVAVEGETLAPRQPIRTVAYAINAETLQGYPLAADTGATNNTVLAMNSSGEVLLGETNPKIEATGTSLTLEAKSLLLNATGGTADIQLTATNEISLISSTGLVNLNNLLYVEDSTGGIGIGTTEPGTAKLAVMGGNMGIGTTTPSEKLHVEGGGIRLGSTSDANNVLDTAAASGAPSGHLYWGNRQLVDSANIGNFGVASVTNTDGTLTISPTTGDVIASLNLANANTWTGAQTFNDLTIADTNVSLTGASTNFASTGNISFNTNQLFINQSSGNVGVGTTGPNFKLDITVSGDGDGVNIKNPTSDGTIESAGFQLKNNQGGDGSFFKLYSENTGVSALNSLLYIKNSVGSISFLANTGSSIGFGIGNTAANADDLVIASTGNVGIGTTEPKVKLEIAGDTGFTWFDSDSRAKANATTGGSFAVFTPSVFGVDGTHNSGLAIDGSYSSLTSTINIKAFGVYTGSYRSNLAFHTTNGTSINEAMRINHLGNVGISTTTPGEILDVVGNVQFSGALMPSGNAGVSSYVLTSAGTGSAPTWTDPSTLGTNYWQRNSNTLSPATITDAISVGSTTPSSALFYVPGTTNNDAYFNLGTGNVGIGTTTPGSALSVVGAIRSSSLSAGGIVKAAATTGELEIATAGTDYEVPLTFESGLTRSANTVRLGGALTQATDIPLSGHDLTFSGASGNIGIGTTTPANRLSITGDADITGNLGIGTTTPGYKLDIAGTGTLFRIASGGTDLFTVTDSLITSNLPHTFTSSGDVSMAYNLYFTNQLSSKIESYGPFSIIAGEPHESNNLTLKTFNAGRLLVESSNFWVDYNNVGIGTTTPSEKLHVEAGGIRLGSTSDANNVLDTAAASGAPSGNLYWGNRQLVDSANIGNFGVASVTNSDGTLTISPTTGDVIASLNLANANTWTGAQTFNDLTIADTNVSLTGASTNFASTGNISFNTNQLFINQSSGNVGIGTTSPERKLEITGGSSDGIKISGSSVMETYFTAERWTLRNIYTGAGWARPLMQFEDAAASSYFQIGGYGSGQSFYYGYIGNAYNDAVLKWKTDGSFGVNLSSTTHPSHPFQVGANSLVVNSSNNVGIGLTNPSRELQVNGGIRASDYYSSDNTAGATSTVSGLVFKNGLYTSGSISGVDDYDHWKIAADGTAGTEEVGSGDTVTITGHTAITATRATRNISISVTDGSITNTQLEYNTGQHLTTTSSPTFSKLTLSSTDNNTIDLSGNTAGITFSNALGGTNQIITAGNSHLALMPHGTGNVGVGTTSPGTDLDVVGTGRFSSTLTASNGLTLTTGALNLTSTSGALSLSGLSASSISTGANNLTITAGNFNTTSTGINSTAIGATTRSTGAFTTLAANSTVTFSDISGATETDALMINSSGVLSKRTLSAVAFDGFTEVDPTWEGDANLTSDIGRTGNVGIGTTTPNAKLEISGDIRLRGDLWFRDAHRYLGTQTNHNLYFRTNNANRMTILSGGDVGIGITTPSEKLQVSGNIWTHDSWIGGQTLYVGSGMAASGQNGPQDKFYGNAELNFSTSTGKKINFLDGWNKDIYVTTSLLRIRNHESGASNQYIEILSDTGSNARIDLGSFNDDGDVITPQLSVRTGTGNVGISTTNPISILDITQSGNTSQVHIGAANTGMFLSSGLDSQFTITGGAKRLSNGDWEARATTASHIGSFDGNISFVKATGLTVGNTFSWDETMRIHHSGNVGIGTTNPRSILNIKGGGLGIGSGDAISTTDGARRSIQIASDTSYGGTYDDHSGYLMYSTMPGGWGTAQLHFARSTNWGTYDSSPTLSLSGQNVGIGTTDPFTNLHVDGGTYIDGDLGLGKNQHHALGKNPSMVPNWSFEVQNTPGSYPDGWESWGGTGSYSAYRSATWRRHGDYSFALQANNSSSHVNARSACIPVTGSTTYQHALSIRSSASTNKGLVWRMTEFKDARCTSGSYIRDRELIAFDAGVSTSWTQHTNTSSSTHSNTRGVKIHIHNYFPNVAATFYIDRIVMRESAYNNTDLAEMVPAANENITQADIVTIDKETGKVKLATKPHDPSLFGIVSTEPAIVLHSENEDMPKATVALAGRVPVKVSTSNGQISSGDPITSSNLPGIGTKATQAGTIIGNAMESTQEWNEDVCPPVSSLGDIEWPRDDGLNPEKPCFRLPDGTYVGKVVVFVNTSWSDSQVYLTDTGGIRIIGEVKDGIERYQLQDEDGKIIHRVGAFSEAAIARLRAGLVETSKVVAENADVAKANINNLTAQTFQSTSGTINKLTTNTLKSAKATIEELTTQRVKIGNFFLTEKDGKLQIQDKDQQTVATIDQDGNTQLTGNLTAQGTISSPESSTTSSTTSTKLAELIADEIQAGKITVDNLTTEGLTATGSSKLAQLMAENVELETLLAQEVQTSSLQAEAIQTTDLTATGSSRLAQLMSDDVETEDLTAQNAQIAQADISNADINTARINELEISQELRAQASRFEQLESKLADFERIQADTAHIISGHIDQATFNQADFGSATFDTATISGTLYADVIAGFEEKVAQAFRQPSLLGNLLGNSASVNGNEVVAIVDSAGYEATGSSDLRKTVAELNLSDDDVVIAPAAAYINQYLEVNGTAYVNDSLAVNNYIVTGDGLKMAANVGMASIDYVSKTDPSSSTLYIQPSGMGRINLMAGVMSIDATGQVTIVGDMRIIGDASVDGNLSANTLLTNLIEANDYDQPTQIKLGAYTDEYGNVIYGEVAGDATESAQIKHSRLEIIDESGSPVATISATGRAEFADGLGIGQEDLSESDTTETITDKTSGRAQLKSGETHIVIRSSKITRNSQIFVTPLGSTNNQVLYIKSQVANDPTTQDVEGLFVVGFDRPAISDVMFNWWIVN